MVIGLYGRRFDQRFTPFFVKLITLLKLQHIQLAFNETFIRFLTEMAIEIPDNILNYTSETNVLNDIDYMLTIGGDGTFLDAVPLVYPNNIPVIGINSGRLGFLANIAEENIQNAIGCIFNDNFNIEYRTLLSARLNPGELDFFSEALNEVTIQKTDNSLLHINLFIDNDFAASYWADGLIIATPTGSTAYSLGVGGPILAPDTENFIISPIASHNLTVRPLVISNKVNLKLEVLSRNNSFLITVDNRTKKLANENIIYLKKAEDSLRMLQFKDESFYTTLRNKLMWSADKRN